MNTLQVASATEKREAAHEVKFLVSTTAAQAVLDWARRELAPDPHGDASSGDGYQVNSLYFDTAALDVYQRKGSYSKSKYRVRRYGSEPNLFLERKLKSRGLVSKRRTRIPDEELGQLTDEIDSRWAGYWFCRRIAVRQLRPRCQIRYQRVARVGMGPEGPVRLTVDRHVGALMTTHYTVEENGAWISLLPNRCILELKFREVMPVIFKALLDEIALTPQPVSKYRLSIQAFGLDPNVKESCAQTANGHISADTLVGATHRPIVREPAVLQPEA